MKVVNYINGLYSCPIKTAADIANGAMVMPGVTAETDLGAAILASGACADAIGYMAGLFDYSEKGTTAVSGATWVKALVQPIFDEKITELEYDQSDTMALAGDESSKTITVTSSEDNWDTGYVSCVSGTGIGQNRFVDTCASGSFTFKTAGLPEWDTGDTCIKILRIFHPLAKISSDGTKLGTDAAAGSWTVVVLDNLMQSGSSAKVSLDPTRHDGLSGLNAAGLHTRFYSRLIIRNTLGHTID